MSIFESQSLIAVGSLQSKQQKFVRESSKGNCIVILVFLRCYVSLPYSCTCELTDTRAVTQWK